MQARAAVSSNGSNPLLPRETLYKLRDLLQFQFGPRLRELSVFGAHASGQAAPSAPVDMLVVVDDLTEPEAEGVAETARFVESSSWKAAADVAAVSPGLPSLEPFVLSSAAARALRAEGHPFFESVDAGKIPLD